MLILYPTNSILNKYWNKCCLVLYRLFLFFITILEISMIRLIFINYICQISFSNRNTCIYIPRFRHHTPMINTKLTNYANIVKLTTFFHDMFNVFQRHVELDLKYRRHELYSFSETFWTSLLWEILMFRAKQMNILALLWDLSIFIKLP